MRTFNKVSGHCRKLALLLIAVTTQFALAQSHPPMETEADFHRAMDELSNWGRW